MGKVNHDEFMKQIERVDNTVYVLDDKINNRIPAMEYEFQRSIKNKADMEELAKMGE